MPPISVLNYICRDCNVPDAVLVEDYRNGNMVCNRCGLCAPAKVIDTHSEWRTFSDSAGDEQSRVGGPVNPLMGDTTLSSTIGEAQGGSSRNKGSQQTALQRAVQSAYSYIQRLGNHIGCSDAILGRAVEIFKIIKQEKNLRGRSLQGIYTACLAHAYAESGVSRTLRELSKHTSIAPNEIGKCIKFVQSVAELDNRFRATPSQLVARYCNALRLPHTAQASASLIVKRCSELKICSNRQPSTIASAAIWFAISNLSLPTPVSDVTKVTDVAETTIQSAWKEMDKCRNSLLPNNDVKMAA
ncbi:hypothetical protein RCL1_003571 [Eukaryota sp. TZLM3-RCL]